MVVGPGKVRRFIVSHHLHQCTSPILMQVDSHYSLFVAGPGSWTVLLINLKWVWHDHKGYNDSCGGSLQSVWGGDEKQLAWPYDRAMYSITQPVTCLCVKHW